ncbi:MAG: DNA polymerase I [Candidatus Omnitrophica bacterium]|nr:DNA polymerase I [Candidatus Omnitrophota bacterium]
MPNVFLIDGTAFCYRAFYAVKGLATSNGRPTNAVYGFAMMLGALRKAEDPDYLAVAFDVGKPTFRHERFESYKIQRKPMPDPLVGQLPLVKQLLSAYRIPIFEAPGYEAEDVLATIASGIHGPGLEIFFVTGDKDMLQLVGPHVRVLNPHKNNGVVDHDAVVERYGVPPERMVDLMALMGDEIDNIPGVPGIGEKTASQLLQRFGSLETLYDRLAEIPSAAHRSALATHRDQVEMARELAKIDAKAPVSVRLDELVVQEPDWSALRRLFRELEFKRLLEELDTLAPAASEAAVRAQLIDRAEAFAPLARLLSREHPAAVICWTATQPQDPNDPSGMLSLAWDADEAWLIPLRTPLAGWLSPLADWLRDPVRPKLGHDLKATIRRLTRLGWRMAGAQGDTMIAAHLVNPARTNPSLSDAVEEWCERRLGQAPAGSLDLLLSAVHSIARATCAILELHAALLARLRDYALESLYRELELPLLEVLAAMEDDGIAVDRDYLAWLKQRMDSQLHALTEELYQLAGCQFNLNSPKQLADVLFQQLKLPAVKRTKTGFSTDSEVLRQLSAHHPLPRKLLEYRELAKLSSTYVDALPQLINPATGRLHTTFHQTATATGRLSSSDPNLQNIPVKTELGRQIRKAFVPSRAGWSLLAADYSQIELRVLAHASGDEALQGVFRQDRDIHRYTASLIYGVPEGEVTSEMRSAMKAVNFGIVYGMSAFGLSREIGIPNEEAVAFIDAYFARYPGVRRYFDAQIAQARQRGFVQTLLGRRRYIPELVNPDPTIRQFGERIAVNAPIQGTAADLIKRAMVQLAPALRERGLAARMLLQVHDELIFETPAGEIQPLARLVRGIMEHAIELSIPVKAIVKTGPNWLEMTELTI